VYNENNIPNATSTYLKASYSMAYWIHGPTVIEDIARVGGKYGQFLNDHLGQALAPKHGHNLWLD